MGNVHTKIVRGVCYFFAVIAFTEQLIKLG